MDAKTYPVTRTDAEWRKRLTPEQYQVMRGHGTERPGSCALLAEHRPGTFHCAGCDTALFEGTSSILGSFLNTIYITVPATVLVILVGSAAGYAFAWMDFPGRDWIFLIVVALLVIPIQIALIPVVKLYSFLGISGSILSVVIFHVSFGLPFAIFLLRNYFSGIPRDLLEAARMDGASVFEEFRHVVLPLSLGGMASTALLCLVLAWNESFWSLNLAAANAGTLASLIASYSSPEGLFWAKLSAASLLAIAPIIVLGWFCQKQLVQGLTFGAVK